MVQHPAGPVARGGPCIPTMQPVRSSLARAAPIAARIATQTPVVSSARVAVATVPRAQVRAMSTTPVLGKEDRSWVDKGSINFAELEPYTNHPDGVRGTHL